jgi:hypothetical protein
MYSRNRELERIDRRDQLNDDLRKFADDMPLLITHSKLLAKLIRAKYTALLDEGFTQEEALELCKIGF